MRITSKYSLNYRIYLHEYLLHKPDLTISNIPMHQLTSLSPQRLRSKIATVLIYNTSAIITLACNNYYVQGI